MESCPSGAWIFNCDQRLISPEKIFRKSSREIFCSALDGCTMTYTPSRPSSSAVACARSNSSACGLRSINVKSYCPNASWRIVMVEFVVKKSKVALGFVERYAAATSRAMYCVESVLPMRKCTLGEGVGVARHAEAKAESRRMKNKTKTP